MSRADVVKLKKDRLGRQWWRVRLYWTDPRTGESRDTRRKLHAPSRGQALVERDKLLDQLRRGVTVSVERKRFREVTQEWIAASKCYSTAEVRKSQSKKLNRHFGDWFIDALTARDCSDYLATMTIQTPNNFRTALIGICRTAVEKHYIEVNVAKLTERVRPKDVETDDDEDEPTGPVPALTPEQLALYLDDMEQHEPDLYPLIHTQFMLGCRFSEVSALTRSRVNLETGLVDLRKGQVRGHLGKTTKGKRARKAALPLEARAVLKKHYARMEELQPRGWDELCFPRPETGRPRPNNYWPSTTVWQAISRSFSRLGFLEIVKGKTHVARHTMITIAEGITPSEALLRAVVGHRTKKVHDGYIHPSDAKVIHLGDVVGRELLKGRKK